MKQLLIDFSDNKVSDQLLYHLNSDYSKKFGAVFTSEKWANKIVAKLYFQKWLDGATVFDPTAGNGVFIRAFLETAKLNDIFPTPAMLNRLYGVELNQHFVDDFFAITKQKYGIDFPRSNFIQGDIFFLKNEIKADILVGNPPWVNFTDLDESYKEIAKPLFRYWGMVKSNSRLLLGGSRADIAGLVILKTIHENLNKNGEALFFLPLSLFHNDGANEQFRTYKVRGVDFSVESILDFNGEKIFEGILGRYGIAVFKRDKAQQFPIKYFVKNENDFKEYKAYPLFSTKNALTVFKNSESEERLLNFEKISIPKRYKPRQGINTCGANDVFFFNNYQVLNDDEVRLVNSFGVSVTVNKKYVFPLTMTSTLRKKEPTVEKLVLIPHHSNGKPLDLTTLQKEKGLFNYLQRYQSLLENRKGVLINTWINKGFWWALMGVGDYCFADYKVMWQSFGDSVFSPKLLKPDSFFSTWQGNQSLNTYIGVSELEYAEKLLVKLSNPIIQEYLSSLRMQGTCNWAQPGRIKKILDLY